MEQLMQMPAGDLLTLFLVVVPVGVLMVILLVCTFIKSIEDMKLQQANRKELNEMLYEIREELNTQNSYLAQFFSYYEDINRDK